MEKCLDFLGFYCKIITDSREVDEWPDKGAVIPGTEERKGRNMEVLNYTVLFEPLEEGGYMAIVPALPGVVTYGESLDEARARAIIVRLFYVK